MWPIPSLKNEFVSVIFSDDAIICSWIQKNSKGTAPFILRAYRRYVLNDLELYNLIPFNVTVIKKYIFTFLQCYDLSDAFILFCLDGSALIEHFVSIPTSTPYRTDFTISHSITMFWQYHYLYSSHEGEYIFYVYAIPRSLILQYKLLAINMQCNLVMLTTKTSALLSAYKNIFGKAFRKSQLAIDMIRCNNNVENLISTDALRRMIMIHDKIDVGIEKEKRFITIACGLFCLKGLGNEKN